MVFSSTIFLYVFLPLVLLAYFLLPGIRIKNILLLLASLFFYAWGEPIYIVLMVISIALNYCFGLWIHRCHGQGKKGKLPLVLSVIANLGALFYFKYFNFTATTLAGLLHIDLALEAVALPIGISFYTFQGMSYVIDVYRESPDTQDSLVQKSIIKLALYISMFPQLIAGPIVRYSDIYPRLSHREHTLDRFTHGIEIFIIGLAKKVMLANILGNTANSIWEQGMANISAAQAWFGAIFYMMQIFFDFCGYSEMAIGLGKMFGFDFMKNFDYPYISCSITEFWRRWHISLSTWFRDYLYIPLGGNRRGNVYFNLSVVFLATGIWHGADWSFILWGVWHGAFMLIERLMRKHNLSVPMPACLKKPMGWLYTMLVVLFGWVVFWMADMQYAVDYFKVMFGITRADFVSYSLGWYLNPRTVFIFLCAIFCCYPWKQLLDRRIPGIQKLWVHPGFIIVKRLALLGLLGLCFLLITNSTYNPFIYFRF